MARLTLPEIETVIREAYAEDLLAATPDDVSEDQFLAFLLAEARTARPELHHGDWGRAVASRLEVVQSDIETILFRVREAAREAARHA